MTHHLDAIEQFTLYFQDKAKDLIKQAHEERFILPDKMVGEQLKEKTYEEFYELIKTNKIYLNTKNKDVILNSQKKY